MFNMTNNVDDLNSFDIFSGSKFNDSVISGANAKFFIIHQNIRSFNANYDYFSAFLDSLMCRPSVMVLSETWHSSGFCNELAGYNSYHIYRERRAGGDVSIYVDDRFNSSLISEFSLCDGAVEVCSVTVKIKYDLSIVVMGIYRPPQGNTNDFFSVLFDDILPQFDPLIPVVICGDLNMDILQQDLASLELLHNFSSFSYVPLISGITRPTDDGGTCIDHIYSNQTLHTMSGIFDVPITDHCPVFTVVETPTNLTDFVLKKFRDHSHNCLLTLKREVGVVFNYLEDVLCGDINSSVDTIMKILYNLYDNCCPERKKCVSPKRMSKPWLTNELILDINRKHSLFRYYKRGIIDFDVYRVYKNNLKRKLRRSKAVFYQNKFDTGDSKIVWKTFNSIVSRAAKKRDSGPALSDFVVDDVDSDYALSQHFNDFFSTVGSNLSNSVAGNQRNALNYMGDQVPNSFFMRPCNANDVERKITSLSNSSAGSIPTHIYKYLKHEISPVISKLFNMSIVEGEFPSCLKISRVVPIHKSGSCSLVSNYRPISILCTLSKIFEKLMYDRLINFLNSNGTLKNNQFGFRKHCSTSDTILQFLNDAYMSLESTSQFVTVCLDLSKAFDTVNHGVLIRKLAHVGVRGLSSRWFTSYLCNRTQYVRIRDSESDVRILSAGVPQGSVLGPLLFLVYINEMSNVCPDLECLHYADDTTIYASDVDINSATMRLQAGLVRLDEWLKDNGLVLNIQKSNCMLISNTMPGGNLPPIMIRDCTISQVDSIKFLGVSIDSCLNFKEHVDGVCRRVSQAIGVVRRISCFVPIRVLMSLYYSLIYPHLTYGVLAWGNSSECNINRIERLRRRFVSMLDCGDGRQIARSPPIFNFRCIYRYFAVIKLFQCYKFNRHIYFKDLFVRLVPDHAYSTRFADRDNFNLPFVRLSQTQRSFLPVAVAVWNTLPDAIREATSLSCFKHRLRKFLLGLDII